MAVQHGGLQGRGLVSSVGKKTEVTETQQFFVADDYVLMKMWSGFLSSIFANRSLGNAHKKQNSFEEKKHLFKIFFTIWA